jgi:hypothetical protein
MQCFHVVFILLIFLQAQAYTRLSRSINISDELLNWDPVLQSLHIVQPNRFKALCSEVLENVLKEKIEAFLSVFAKELFTLQSLEWLQVANSELQDYFVDSTSEVIHLSKGFIQPRSFCNDKAGVNDNYRCFYFKMAYEYEIAFTQISSNNLFSRPLDNLSGIVSLVELLFNRMWYDHAEALAIFTLSNLVPDFFRHLFKKEGSFIFSNIVSLPPPTIFASSLVDLSVYQEMIDYMLRLTMAISEVERVRSRVDNSVWMTLFHYHLLTKRYSDDIPVLLKKLTFPQLRILLTIPILPPSYSIGVRNREVMISDLQLFLSHLLTNNIKLSLKVS